jgi:hypothetical protein
MSIPPPIEDGEIDSCRPFPPFRKKRTIQTWKRCFAPSQPLQGFGGAWDQRSIWEIIMTDQTVITAIRDLVWASIEDRLEEKINEIIDDDLNSRVSNEVTDCFNNGDFNDYIREIVEEKLSQEVSAAVSTGVSDYLEKKHISISFY